MNVADTMWKIFENTGHIGAYLIYKDYSLETTAAEDETETGKFRE